MQRGVFWGYGGGVSEGTETRYIMFILLLCQIVNANEQIGMRFT